MSSAPELAVVWGATGFVGRQLVRSLLASGWRVRALVRDLEAANLGDSNGLEIRCISMRSTRREMAEALTGADVVYHCAGHGNDRSFALQNFVEGTADFALSAREAGVRHYVQLSTVAVYGASTGVDIGPDTPVHPRNEYARSRHAAEQRAFQAFEGALDRCTVVRIPMVVGRGMQSDALRALFRVLRIGIFLHPGDRSAVLNCVGVNRLVASLVSMGTPGAAPLPTVFQLADNLPWSEIVAIYAEASGRRIRRIPVPPGIAGLAALASASRRSPLLSVSVLNNSVTFRDQGDWLPARSSAPRTVDDVRALAMAEVVARSEGAGVLSVTAVNLFARLGAGLLPLVVAWQFGATAVTDALFWTFSVVLFLGGAFSSALEVVAVPWANRKQGAPAIDAWLSAPAVAACALAAAAVAILLALNGWLMSSGHVLTSTSSRLAESYLIQSALAIVFMMLAGLWSGVLLARSQFLAAAGALSVKWWSILVAVVALGYLGLTAYLGLAFLLGEVLRVFALWQPIRAELTGARSLRAWRDAVMDFPWGQFGFSFLAFVSLHVNPIVDRMMASWLGDGSVSLFEYAWTVNLAPAMIFTSGYLIIWYSEISDKLGRDSRAGLADNLQQMRASVYRYSAFAMGAVIAPMGVIIAIGPSIGNLAAIDVATVCWLSMALVLGLPFTLLNASYFRLLTAFGRTSAVFATVGVKIALNIVGNVLLIERFGLMGLAFSTVISEAVCWVVFTRIANAEVDETRA